MLVNWKKYLILFIIALVCSITPALAIQTGGTNNTINNTIPTWKEGVEHVVDIINQDDTELTPEQTEYLEKHLDDAQISEDTVFNSLQNYVDFVNQILNEQNNTNSRKRFIYGHTSLNDIIDHLHNVKHIPVTKATYTYSELSYRVNLNSTNASYINGTKVIVQLNDGGYVVYAELLNITREGITLKKNNEEYYLNSTEFMNHHIDDEDINVIIVPSGWNRAVTVNDTINYQCDNLDQNIHKLKLGEMLIAAGGISAFGFAGVKAGISMLNKYQKERLAAVELNGVSTTSASTAVQNPNTALLGYIREVNNDTELSYKKKAAILVLKGSIIVIVCSILLYWTYRATSYYENEKSIIQTWQSG
jgi:hypothetical protein